VPGTWELDDEAEVCVVTVVLGSDLLDGLPCEPGSSWHCMRYTSEYSAFHNISHFTIGYSVPYVATLVRQMQWEWGNIVMDPGNTVYN